MRSRILEGHLHCPSGDLLRAKVLPQHLHEHRLVVYILLLHVPASLSSLVHPHIRLHLLRRRRPCCVIVIELHCVVFGLVKCSKGVNFFMVWFVLGVRDSSRLNGSVNGCGGDREW